MKRLLLFRSNRKAILFFTCSAHAFTHVYMLIFPAVVQPMRESFSLSRSHFLGYATISTVLFGLGAIPSGWLGDRIGEKKLLVAFFFLTALGGTLLGLAQGSAALAAGMAAVGLGASIFHPVGNAMIAKGIRDPGKAMGVNGFWGSLGTAAGPVLAVQIAGLLGWRWAYLVLTLPMLLLGVWLACTPMEGAVARGYGRDRASGEGPGESGGHPRGESRRSAEPAGSRQRFGGSWIAMVLFLLLAMTCGGFYFHLITTMLPTHLAEKVTVFEVFHVRSNEFVEAGYVTGVIYLIGGLGQILSGYLVHHREGRGLYILVLALATPLVFSLSGLRDVSLVASASLMAIVLFAVQPIENVLLARYSPPSMRGFLFGAKFVLAFGVGGLGTWLSGYVSEAYDVPAVFVTASGFTALGALFATLAYFSRRTR